MDGQGAVFKEKRASKGSSRAFQIFVKMGVPSNDKISDVVRRSVACDYQDMYATCEGWVLRKDDELKICAVRDGGTALKRTRGGGRNKVKKKQAASTRRSEQRSAGKVGSDESPANEEWGWDGMIRMTEASEEFQKMIMEGSDVEVEERIRVYLAES